MQRYSCYYQVVAADEVEKTAGQIYFIINKLVTSLPFDWFV